MSLNESQIPSCQVSNESEMKNAEYFRDILALQSSTGEETKLSITGNMDQNKPIVLGPSLVKSLLSFLSLLSQGSEFKLVQFKSKLTTLEAANILNVSHKYFLKLLENDVIPFESKEHQRFVQAKDLFEYKLERDAKRENALSELEKLDNGSL